MKKIAFISLFCCATLSAQKIERTKDELKSSNNNRSNSSSSSKSSSSDDEDCSIWVDLFINVLGAVFKYGLIGDYNSEDHLYNELTAYPYIDGFNGNYTSDSTATKKFRIDLEDHFMYNSNDMFGNHMKAKIRPFEYFYFQADYRELFERRLDGMTDNLALFHLNFCYDRVRLGQFNLGWNLGATYVGSEVRKAGFCYGLSADYFPGKHISFSGSAKWSSINGHPVNAYEFQGKFHHRQFFGSVGFQHLKIATPTYNFFTVGGGFYL